VEGWGVGKLGPGGLILGEGDEARFCQVDPLVVQTITGRLSLAKPVRWNPCVRASPGATHIVCDRSPRFLPIGVLAIRGTRRELGGVPPGDSSFSPHPLAGVPVLIRLMLDTSGRAEGRHCPG
jgi:hypothetical protein